MNIDNVEFHLRNNYDRLVLLNYRTAKKLYLRVELVRLDIYFLKSCRSKDIIPKFLWFKTANRNLGSSAAYKECQRRLLNAEINYKYQHLNKTKKMYRYSTTCLQQYCPGDLFERLQEIIITICSPLIKSKKETVENKIHGHSLRVQPQHPVDRKVVKNLSARILSDDQIECLAHGLDYGLLPRRFDEMSAVGNIEQFFHRATNIFQHHKKLIADLKDQDKVMPNDIRVLNTKEMTLASNLRSLTDSFRFQVDHYRKRQNMVHVKQKPYYLLLKDLKQDKNIIVTRPDKGRGIVLMNRSEYTSKMNQILNDSTKFERLVTDPTLTRERKLTALLSKLKNQGYISQEIYFLAKPTGSNPGRLYGLPKIHKENIPLRPVLSAIGTFNYNLGKVLKQMLSHIIQNEAVIKDSFAFVKYLESIPETDSKLKMVSFDISSLYTNIPLDETIGIILNHLYPSQVTSMTIPKNDMKELLTFATKNSHFLFNGKIYDQIDGVSMGSPLAPLLAEIFLQDFEKKHQTLFKEMGIIHWKRYVDDTFVIIDSKVTADNICSQLSQLHPSLKFTREKETLIKKPTQENLSEEKNSSKEDSSDEDSSDEDSSNEQSSEEKSKKGKEIKKYKLPFLDVLITRKSGIGFETQIYRKDTFSGLITKWDSFVPKTYKYNAISSMVYRAIRICSTYEALHKEFDFIRALALKNGYPIAFVESVIRRQLNLRYAPRAITPQGPQLETVVLRVPYYGKPSQIYAKRVMAAVTKQYPLKKVRVVYLHQHKRLK
jgi:hypothetical protein